MEDRSNGDNCVGERGVSHFWAVDPDSGKEIAVIL